MNHNDRSFSGAQILDMRYSARLATNLKDSRYSGSDSLAVIRRDIERAKKAGIVGLVPVDNRTNNIVLPKR